MSFSVHLLRYNLLIGDAQNSEMLSQFLLSLLLILLHQDEFPLNNEPVSTCLFKKIVQLTYVDTMATTSHI